MNLINIDFSIENKWERATYIREMVLNGVLCVYDDENIAESISMVCSELVGNAIKHGDQNYAGEDAVRFTLKGTEDEVIIEVKNKIKTDQKTSVRRLDDTIQWIRGHQSPYEAYVQQLKNVSRRRSGDGLLGLVRIAYEGGGITDFFVDDENWISVSSVIPL